MTQQDPKSNKEAIQIRSRVESEQNVNVIELDGNSLHLDTLMLLSNGDVSISINDRTMLKLTESRQVVTDIIQQGLVRYGINTGYGLLSKVVIKDSDLEKLSYNLIRFIIWLKKSKT